MGVSRQKYRCDERIRQALVRRRWILSLSTLALIPIPTDSYAFDPAAALPPPKLAILTPFQPPAAPQAQPQRKKKKTPAKGTVIHKTTDADGEPITNKLPPVTAVAANGGAAALPPVTMAGDAASLPPADPALIDPDAMPLYLEVFINGHGIGLVAEFIRRGDGGFAMKAREMEEIGIRAPEGKKDDDLVALAEVGATARYDEMAQQMHIRISERRRIPKVTDLHKRGLPRDQELTQPTTGLVLNYSLFAAASTDTTLTKGLFNGASLNLDGRLFSAWGTLRATGFARIDASGRTAFRRLDTYWTYTDRKRALSWRVGDLVSAGPAWARAIRLGGVMVSRNYGVRDDVVTTPLPSLSATAAVPTTADVYVNNLKVHSQRVAPGPFTITNIPAISSSGEARLVLRDASGREIVKKKRFHASPDLLRKGLFDFSLAVGAPRRNYGQQDFDYALAQTGLIGSFRYGLTDQVTLHGHAEISRDVQLIGGGLAAALAGRALIKAAGAASHSDKGVGFLLYGAINTRYGPFTLHASTMRTFGPYADMATVSALPATVAVPGSSANAAFPKAIDTISAGIHLRPTNSSLSVNYMHIDDGTAAPRHLVSLALNQPLFKRTALYVSAFADVARLQNFGVSAGITIPLGGDRGHVSTGYSRSEYGKHRFSLTAGKSLGRKINSMGWQASVTKGDTVSVNASLSWRARYMTLRGRIGKQGGGFSGNMSAEGALVMAGGGLFAANRVNDAFAVVNVGAPNVLVKHENRPYARSGRNGKVLITDMRALARNRISIDATDLPVDARIPTVQKVVAPAQRGAGVIVDFKVKPHVAAALVVFKDTNGKDIPMGSEVKLKGSEETWLVGYDGQAYLEGLGKINTVTIDTGEATCTATFRYARKDGEQEFIGPVICK